MTDKPDLITLLMAVSFLHVYRVLSLSKEDLFLLLATDTYKNKLMMVPYENNNYRPEIKVEIQHIKRIMKAHELVYKELLSNAEES